uniref:ATP-dependent DNA helicase PIF1 n=1 Tax=Blastobotrys adeninivorans TaxID=409370 RepID=A0A060THB6_BLAAD
MFKQAVKAHSQSSINNKGSHFTAKPSSVTGDGPLKKSEPTPAGKSISWTSSKARVKSYEMGKLFNSTVGFEAPPSLDAVTITADDFSDDESLEATVREINQGPNHRSKPAPKDFDDDIAIVTVKPAPVTASAPVSASASVPKSVPAPASVERLERPASGSDKENAPNQTVRMRPVSNPTRARPEKSVPIPEWKSAENPMKRPWSLEVNMGNKRLVRHQSPDTGREKPDTSESRTKAQRSASEYLVQPPTVSTKDWEALGQDQKRALKAALDGRNLFFTGAAGTGKSYLMHIIISQLNMLHRGRSSAVAVCATTGLAAINIGGTTLHRWAGIGLGKEDASILVKNIKKNKKAVDRWKNCRVLIIDEVSMLDSLLFDKLNIIAQNMHDNTRPFGGIQLILTGDFLQLPPVSQRSSAYCFNAKVWPEAVQQLVILRQVFRQKGDQNLIDILGAIREGKVSNEIVNQLKQLERPVTYDDGIEPTELYALRNEVERANAQRLDRLGGPSFVYDAVDTGTQVKYAEEGKKTMFDDMMAPKRLVLKLGAQVMVIKNLDNGLVNGSRGAVIGFAPEQAIGELEHRLMDEGFRQLYNEMVQDFYLPKEPLIDIKPSLRQRAQYVGGREYVKLLERYAEMFRSLRSQRPLPVVRFDNQVVAMEHQVTEAVDADGKTVLASRRQLPLIHSWALSIHKSQGQTLDRVIVDLNKTFECGMAYVALSRARSKETLQIRNFSASKVMVKEEVVRYYKSIENA